MEREITKEIEQHPLWTRCYPRIYESAGCGQYYSPKEVARQLFGTLGKLNSGCRGTTDKMELLWGSLLAKYRMPLYWVSKDMAQAIQQTKPPLILNWAEEHLPMEAASFMVPKGSIPHEEAQTGEATFVSFCRVHKGQVVKSLYPECGLPTLWSENESFMVLAGTAETYLLHWNLGVDAKHPEPTIDLQHLDELMQEFTRETEHRTDWIYQPHMTEADNRFMVRCLHFLFGILLLMLSRPEQVTHGSCRKWLKAKPGLSPKEFWSPNVIGEHYKIRRLILPQGTHASPRYHWVRGFHRLQHYGSKNELTKVIWVEPFERGIDVTESV